MNYFLKKCSLFFIQFLIISFLLIIYYILTYNTTIEDIPAPRLSDSYSLNEKIAFLRKNKKSAEIVSIGSSISLNNLNSETVVKYFGTESYLNTSSWGMNMQDNYSLLKMINEIYHPKILIIASSISEFETPSKQVDYTLVENYVKSSDFIASFYHLICFNLRYYIDNFKFTKLVRSAANQYKYLVFDKYGGVGIDSTDFKIDAKRWNKIFNYERINIINYNYLDSISLFCKSNNIKLLFFQNPYREGVYTNLENKRAAELYHYIDMVGYIVRKYNHTFINTNKILWSDSLFIDSDHLNVNGAKIFTTYCLKQVELGEN